jgi:hypothetical protein
MELTGKLKVKRDTQVVSDKFQKREFVLTDESSQYPQDILFQLSQDKVTLIDKVNEGEIITAHFNLRGREWTNPQGEVKYFNTLDVWRVESSQIGASEPAQAQSTTVEDESDDLPF